MTDEIPQIDLTMPQAAVCARHGEPFRKAWPKGFAQLVILTVETLQTDGELATEAAGDIERVNALLVARPACERVPIGRLRQAYVDADIGVEGRCVSCGRVRLGTEYQRTVRRSIAGVGIGTRVVTDSHVCFDCVLERMVPA